MSRPRYRWWGYVKSVVRTYPEHRARLAELRRPSLSGTGGGGGSCGASRATEAAATRELPRDEMREYEAVEQAIQATRALPNGGLRLDIIELVYFRQSHTLRGAADTVGYSYGHAKRVQEAFLLSVAENLGVKEKR
ncbi:MAG: hypothetical protein LIO70_06950 [Clostridiales bacterium]|nr:hypothetical protein [Clostridiales bacterium]